jgi:hypothetical protein
MKSIHCNWNTKTIVATLVIVLGLNFIDICTSIAQELRLNQIQVIGSHNSYHVAPHSELLQLISLTSQRLSESIDYTHRPLAEQFSELGIRQIELDVFLDPNGGLFSNPAAHQTLKLLGKNQGPDPNLNGILEKPGLKVLHVPDVDYVTNTPTFKLALRQVRDWSRSNPKHVPIMILVELKDSRTPALPTVPIAFNENNVNCVDQEIDQVFQKDEIFTPDELRGEMQSLPEAIARNGWPELSRVRGKIMFALDNEGRIRDAYLKDNKALKNRRMFVTPPTEAHPSAAFFKLNDPIRDFEKIRRLVKAGYLIRTRADSDTRQSRSGNTHQRDKALASGAQFVSTDYPEPRREFSEYHVRLPQNVIARPNPVSTNGLKPFDVE